MNNNVSLISKELYEIFKYYVIFLINGKRFAISVNNVVEIINMPEIETSSIIPENIIGVFNYNGSVINLIDLCGFTGEIRTDYSINNKIIILNFNGNYFGIHTPQIGEILPFSMSNIQNVPYNTENGIIKEIYKAADGNINIIDSEAIFKIISEENRPATNIDYAGLMPADEKSKQILKIRKEHNLVVRNNYTLTEQYTLLNQFILFTIDNFNYFLDLKYVKEFIPVKDLKITQLPYTQNYIKGIVNFKGAFLIVIDLKTFLNKNSQPSENNKGKLIIVESKNFDIAFLVDDIKYIKNLKNIKKIHANNVSSPYIYEEFVEDNVLYSILNFEKIIQDDKLYINIE